MTRFLTAQEIAAGTGLAVGTVYWLAHRHNWERTRGRPRRYLAADVFRSLADTPGVSAA